MTFQTHQPSVGFPLRNALLSLMEFLYKDITTICGHRKNQFGPTYHMKRMNFE